jgi:hypothetical protein
VVIGRDRGFNRIDKGDPGEREVHAGTGGRRDGISLTSWRRRFDRPIVLPAAGGCSR